jgi:hypothetical protein
MIDWYPEKISAPAELTAVSVQAGKLDRKTWISALADRVTNLALQEQDPLEAANEACRAMNLPPVDSPNQLGDALVTHNLELRTQLNVAQLEDQWPAQAKPQKGTSELMKDVDLQSWVELALSQVNESDLD